MRKSPAVDLSTGHVTPETYFTANATSIDESIKDAHAEYLFVVPLCFAGVDITGRTPPLEAILLRISRVMVISAVMAKSYATSTSRGGKARGHLFDDGISSFGNVGRQILQMVARRQRLLRNQRCFAAAAASLMSTLSARQIACLRNEQSADNIIAIIIDIFATTRALRRLEAASDIVVGAEIPRRSLKYIRLACHASHLFNVWW